MQNLIDTGGQVKDVFLTSSRQAHEHFKTHFQFTQEEFWLASLNNELKVISTDMIFRGTANLCPIHLRDIIRTICEKNACSFIIAHNHPSGNPLPSRADLLITRRIWKASKLMDIPMADHLILSKNEYTSLADRGFFRNLRPN